MNIEVDVAAQLFPNPFTMLFTLLVTGVLFLAIYKLVFNPAREMLAKRQAYYDDKLSSADKMNKEANLNLENSKQAIIKADLMADEIRNNAKNEAKVIKDDIVTGAKKEAEDYINRAKDRMEKEKQELISDINEQIVDVALAASEKLIGEKDVISQDRESIERFIKEYEHESR